MFIDGEVVQLRCKDCGERFSRMVGYGPICPTPEFRSKMLKENDTRCPKCNSRNYKVYHGGLLDRLVSFLINM